MMLKNKTFHVLKAPVTKPNTSGYVCKPVKFTLFGREKMSASVIGTSPVKPPQTARQIPPLKPSRMDVTLKSVREIAN